MKKIIQSLLFPVKDERGIAKILVAFSIVALLGFTALVVDAGGIYFEKSRLQKALDAAVLGGAQHLKVSEEKAEETAISLALKNGFTVSGDEVITGEEFIEIEKTVNKKLTFARILGFHDADIHAIARAELVQALVKRNGVVPIGFVKTEYQKNEVYSFFLNPGAGNKGNYEFLNIDGSKNEKEDKGGSNGTPSLVEGIENGSEREVGIGTEVFTSTGSASTPEAKAFQARIDRDKNKSYCNKYETADNSCSRVVIVPLVNSFEDISGSKKVKIIGFAAFWIAGIEKEKGDYQVTGRFIDYVTTGTFEPGEETNIYGVKLVK